MDKEITKALEILDEGNPYSCMLRDSSISKIDRYFSTGSYVLDAIISGKIRGGGVPENRVILFNGESQTLKSSIIQKILANAQKQGMIPVIFDSENAIEPESAARMGLDISKVKYVPIFSIEQCRNSIHKFLTAVKEKGLEGKFIIAIDSLGNLQSELETKRIVGDSTSVDMGGKARAMKSLMQNCTQLAATTKTTIICTNHVYDDPAAMYASMVKKTPGGKSLLYQPTVTVQLSRKPVREEDAKNDKGGLSVSQRNYVGIIINALTVKNRIVKQYLEGEIYISFKSGADKYHGLLSLACDLGIMERTGTTYSLNGVNLGRQSTFHRDSDLWENKVIPLIEEKIKTEWAYSTSSDSQIEDELASVVEEVS